MEQLAQSLAQHHALAYSEEGERERERSLSLSHPPSPSLSLSLSQPTHVEFVRPLLLVKGCGQNSILCSLRDFFSKVVLYRSCSSSVPVLYRSSTVLYCTIVVPLLFYQEIVA